MKAIRFLFEIATVIIAAVGIWFVYDEYKDRKIARMTRAWELLRQTAEQQGNFGQIAALESLYHDNANLQQLDVRGRYLAGLTVPRAKLTDSNFQSAYLYRADFRGATLVDAVFDDATLWCANLSDADLRRASFNRAKLAGADVSGANLSEGVTDFSIQTVLEQACARPDRPPGLPSHWPNAALKQIKECDKMCPLLSSGKNRTPVSP